ncbi:hypothetical protein AYI69_g6610, partial [Smittium culicis]
MKAVYTSSLLAILSIAKTSLGNENNHNYGYELNENNHELMNNEFQNGYYPENYNGYQENQQFNDQVYDYTNPELFQAGVQARAPIKAVALGPYPISAAGPAPVNAQSRTDQKPKISRRARKIIQRIAKADAKAVNIARTINAIKTTKPEVAAKLAVKLEKIKAKISKAVTKVQSVVDPNIYQKIVSRVKITNPNTDLTAKPKTRKEIRIASRAKKLARRLRKLDARAVNIARTINAIKATKPEKAAKLAIKLEKTKARVQKIVAKIQTMVSPKKYQKIASKVKITNPNTNLNAKPKSFKAIRTKVRTRRLAKRIARSDAKAVQLARRINAVKNTKPEVAAKLAVKLEKVKARIQKSVAKLQKVASPAVFDKISAKIKITNPKTNLTAKPKVFTK